MKSNGPLPLDQQLCFALYSTSLAMTQKYKKPLAEIGLTYPQYTVMLILWQKDGVSLKYISEKLGPKPGALTPVIKRMEADGLVIRRRGLEDDRTLSIELTKKGDQLRVKGAEVSECVASSTQISNEEIIDLQQKLTQLREELLK